ncbi:MAG: AAA family ATPase [Chitinophagaceae bacterium]|nr:AAA family ATPase [Chitinophagaceae bacterium]
MITKEQHIAFYEVEIQTQLDDWRTYIRKRMNLLIKDKELFIGRFWDVDNEKGTAIIRFKRKEAPRLHWPYFLGIVGNAAEGSPNDWTFTFQEFIYSSDKNYYNKQGSDGQAIQYVSSDTQYVFLEVTFEDSSFFDLLKKEYFVHGHKPLLVVAKMYPPINYLINLKDFVSNSGNKLDSLNIKETLWNPTDIDNDSVSTDFFIDIINSNDTALVQGPPGTGKSYQAAAICNYYLKQNKALAVCALTNKALLEISGQPGLTSALNAGVVYKTNLSMDEQKLNPKLQSIAGFLPKQGSLLLTTYYKLSEFYKDLINESKRFDLLIIEEASQAFFATLIMFEELASKVMIIGDQQQLPPIVITNKKKLLKINPNIDKVQLGLDMLANTLNPMATFRLTKTRRLTSDASKITGLFYDNKLKSNSPLNGKISHPQKVRTIFHPNGGVTIASIDIVGEYALNQAGILERINNILVGLFVDSPDISIAILVPTVNLELLLTQAISEKGFLKKNIIISTIHRIQGITTDYTIYYMPLSDTHFELDPKIFNVATSRAKRGTLIITKSIVLMEEMEKTVHHFLTKCKDVTVPFINLNS